MGYLSDDRHGQIDRCSPALDPAPQSQSAGSAPSLRDPQPDTVRLYLEAHITIEPVFDERRAQAAEIANRFNFRLADLLMKKRAEDTEERSSKDTLMTGHSKSKADITHRLQHLVRALQSAGFKVWRYKIEDTLVDSRTEDEFNLLGDQTHGS